MPLISHKLIKQGLPKPAKMLLRFPGDSLALVARYLGRVFSQRILAKKDGAPPSALDRPRLNSFLSRVVSSAETQRWGEMTEASRESEAQLLWQGEQGNAWFEKDRASTDLNDLLTKRKSLLRMVDHSFSEHEFGCVVEIGFGDGRFLAHLVSRYPGVETFSGVDLNRYQVDYARSNWPGLDLRCADSSDLATVVRSIIEEKSTSKPALVIACRTLTMMTERQVAHLFSDLATANRECRFALFEQSTSNLRRDRVSKARDVGFYSHNYPLLLTKAGWMIESTKVDFNSHVLNDYGISVLARTT